MVSTETLSDHVTFTTIQMPLVRTPIIAPSQRLNPVRAISAEHAAAMVVRGLVEKPVRIDTPLGTLADIGSYFTPKLSRRVLHQVYLSYPDWPAARGLAPTEPGPAQDSEPPRRTSPPVRAAARLGTVRVPRGVKRAVRLAPGVHW